MVGEHTDISFGLNIGPPLTERQEDCSGDKRGQKTINLCLTCRRSRSDVFHPAGFADSSASVFLHEREVLPASQEQRVTHVQLNIVDTYCSGLILIVRNYKLQLNLLLLLKPHCMNDIRQF